MEYLNMCLQEVSKVTAVSPMDAEEELLKLEGAQDEYAEEVSRDYNHTHHNVTHFLHRQSKGISFYCHQDLRITCFRFWNQQICPALAKYINLTP